MRRGVETLYTAVPRRRSAALPCSTRPTTAAPTAGASTVMNGWPTTRAGSPSNGGRHDGTPTIADRARAPFGDPFRAYIAW